MQSQGHREIDKAAPVSQESHSEYHSVPGELLRVTGGRGGAFSISANDRQRYNGVKGKSFMKNPGGLPVVMSI